MRYAKGFDDSNHVKQVENVPNHFAWTLGHLALVLNRVAERIDGKPIPETDFVKADGFGGGAGKFDTESVSMNSSPKPDATLYPSAARCVEIFSASVDRCAAAFENASDVQLDALTKWGQTEVPLWTTGLRMVFHNGNHAGQLADLRRGLKMGSIFA
jgi:hypothetical protein